MRESESIEAIVSRAIRAHQGILLHGAAAGLTLNTPEVFGSALERLVGTSGAAGEEGADGAHNRLAADYVRARVNLNAQLEAAQSYCVAAMNVLKTSFGQTWNPQWRAVGFQLGSLAKPKQPFALLNQLRAFFEGHPEKEIPALSVTAAHAETLASTLSAAYHRLDSAKGAWKSAVLARREALQALSRRLTSLKQELRLHLSGDDPRWMEFGFGRPADGHIPFRVQALQLRMAGDVVVASWRRSVRAMNYRVQVRVAGDEDAEPEQVALTSVNEMIIPDLQSGTRYLVMVSAVNASGETQASMAEITLPEPERETGAPVAAGILPASELGILPGGMEIPPPSSSIPAVSFVMGSLYSREAWMPGGKMPPSPAGRMPTATAVTFSD